MMRRAFLAVIIGMLSMSCGGNPPRPPLAPSAAGAGNDVAGQQADPGAEVPWGTFSTTDRAIGFSRAAAPPINLTFFARGTTVFLIWDPAPGSSPTSYIVDAGTGSGLTNITSFNTGSALPYLTVTGVPAGIYYVRVRAVDPTGAGGASNEVVIAVSLAPCTVSVSPTVLDIPPFGGTAVISVASNCNWTVTSTAAWITITSGSTGAGNGSVTISGAANSGSARSGVVTIAGQLVTVNQASGALRAGFQLFDPGSQPDATTTCRINGSPTTCQLRSTSFTFGSNTIVHHAWTVTYTYGTTKVLTQSGPGSTFSFSDSCGGPGSSAEGPSQPLSVTLTVTDNLGNTATATSGSGDQPALNLRLFSCP